MQGQADDRESLGQLFACQGHVRTIRIEDQLNLGHRDPGIESVPRCAVKTAISDTRAYGVVRKVKAMP